MDDSGEISENQTLMIFQDLFFFFQLLRKHFMFAKLGDVHEDIGICKITQNLKKVKRRQVL